MHKERAMKVIELTDKEFQIVMWALQAFREQKKEDISRRSFAKWYADNNSGGWVPGTEHRGTMEDISIIEPLAAKLEKHALVSSARDDLDIGEGWGTSCGESNFEVENDWEVTPYGEQIHHYHLDHAIEGQEEDYEEEIDLYKTWGGD
jgi:hypothetical protein